MPIKLLLRKKLFTRRSLSGFTLIEILLVVLIIGILAGLVIPNMVGRGEEARREGAMADIHGGIGAALDLYELDTGTYPARLEDLITDPGSVKNWRGPYVKRRLPKDPWGNEYSYKYPGINNTASYDLSSRGSDGQEGTADDISNWDTD
ncbi:MAG: type II secretion system major pseudopilin GspG [Candidatus Omnitrophica bacterium]|nr:type II secretion system major pseudopilin GspG [Candidatus Omnitrophota bacterium]